ncbi:sigma-54-dependent transcriptional regulator [Paraliomyxa miuraensis]|uniref:sigma-54-dependent transcriptional regulator n=1 Tax=Paraliomyxa miuraensis TaxID=376150 RepID=UPI00225BCB9E|nr:sigma-54 dependent transcriptional regulator [Paraliomyxa miuraensis]
MDDDPALSRVLGGGLRRRGFDVVRCPDASEAQGRLHDPSLEAVVTDLRMPGRSGVDLCRAVAATRPDVPVLVVTGFGSFETAIEVLRAGAHDLIPKPVDVELLAHAVRRAVTSRAMRLELARLREAAPRPSFERMVGRSPAMRSLFDLVDRVAGSDVTVLITGETGTGKELLARAIHDRSSRRDGPWQAVNCAAIPEPLLESELFGHVRGAFTDAKANRRGLLQRAHGGTLVLDEVGELPGHLQAKLLRALQERTVRPVGSDEEVPFDARIIAATNRDLEQEVGAGRFREDLLFRLSVVTLEIPPLRCRDTDVLLLAQTFVDQAAAKHGRPVTGITPQAGARLLAYPWPGNVRELENCMERAVVLTRYTTLTVEDLPPRVRDHVASVPTIIGEGDLVTLAELERRYVRHVLAVTGGNKSVAARILGVDRKTLARRLGGEVGSDPRES